MSTNRDQCHHKAWTRHRSDADGEQYTTGEPSEADHSNGDLTDANDTCGCPSQGHQVPALAYEPTYGHQTFTSNHFIGNAEKLPGDGGHVRDGGGEREPDLLEGPEPRDEEGDGIEKGASSLGEGEALNAGLKSMQEISHVVSCLFVVCCCGFVQVS